MVRPIVLMAEVEPPEGLSARKLVLETGKFNVITAYSVEEALDTLDKFPNVHAVVLHISMCADGECDEVIARIKEHDPEMLVIALSPNSHSRHKGADHNVSSHEPQELLNLLRSEFGDPRNIQEQPQKRRA
jgi:DNA-binding NtrC family response regulator